MVLPAHTSHRTQPLDLTIFSPLKSKMTAQVDCRNMYGIVGRLDKKDWVIMLAEARGQALTEDNIKVSCIQNELMHRLVSDLRQSIPSCPPN